VGEDDHVRGVDFRLEQGGILEGVLRFPDASPAGRAWVSAFSEAHPRQGGFSDGDHFRIGLAAGTYLVDAGALRTPADELGCQSVEVEIVAGETHHVELGLVPARRVNLRILQDGRPVTCELDVRDARGKPEAVRRGPDGAAWLLLTPGPHTLRAEREGQELARAFDVLAREGAQERELVFE